MGRPRFSVGNLLVVVLFLGVAFAALREGTALWDSAVFSLAIVLMLAAVLLAVHREGRGRAFWVGFALVGWVYLDREPGAADPIPAADDPGAGLDQRGCRFGRST